MAILKCKMCGGDLVIEDGTTVAECEYCGSKQTVPTADNEKKMTLFARANRLRAACEFDKAAGVYESIVAEFAEEAEAYWGLVLCKYGIEYVDDPATGKKIPTCHRSSFDSIMDDSDFEQVMENADPIARRVYREEAKTIEDIRKGILEVSSKEEPYDIFICYKETDENGERTIDSVIAQDIYNALTDEDYRVFFARISLEDKLGQEYEPYIFAALNSAKIMLAVGTDYEYYNAVWVKNEWSRFLMLMVKDKKKMLIPCYKDIDAYDIPKEFKHLQAQDMGKVGAMQDLLRGIKKILPKQKKIEINALSETPRENTENSKIKSLLKRVFIFLEDKDWDNANKYCERILDIDPENGEAYFCKLMAKNRLSKREDLKKLPRPFEDDGDYKKAVRFGDDSLRYELSSYIEFIKKSNLYARTLKIISESHNPNQLLEMKKVLESLHFRDSDDQVSSCQAAYERETDIIRRDEEYNQGLPPKFQDLTTAENKLKEETIKINNSQLSTDEAVPAQAELDQVQKEMKTLSEKLRTLGAFKKKEKEALSARIVSLGKSISQIRQEIDRQKQQCIDERNSMFETKRKWEQQISNIKKALFAEAEHLTKKKFFVSACSIYTFLGDYANSQEKLIQTKAKMKQYRNPVHASE